MPSPGDVSLADDALTQFGGSRVAYVGEWGSGMTATAGFHRQLLLDWQLETPPLPLPCPPLLTAELHLFRRRPPATQKQSQHQHAPAEAGGEAASELQALPEAQPALCDACGARPAMRRCPHTRQMRICSPECYAASIEAHRALIAFAFCGASVSSNPAWSAWEPCSWVEEARAAPRQWAALAAATPQAEPGAAWHHDRVYR